MATRIPARPRLVAALATLGLFWGGVAALAQGQFTVGDSVEGHSYAYGGPTYWGRGQVVEVDISGSHVGPYLVEFDNQHFRSWLGPDDVRPAADAAPQPPSDPPPLNPTRAPAAAPAAHAPQNAAAASGGFQVGDRVDDYEKPIPGAKGSLGFERGTVLAVQGNSYKVRHDGCAAGVLVDISRLQPAASVAVTDPAIQFIVGQWRMSEPGAPNTITVGTATFRERGFGGAAPPLQVMADGGYVWFSEADRPPVQGIWLTDARIERTTTGTEVKHGVLLTDAAGQLWKAYREDRTDGGGDSITVRKMCQGIQMMGTRM